MDRMFAVSAAFMLVGVLGKSSPREIDIAAYRDLSGAFDAKLVDLRYLQENLTEDNDTLVVDPTPPPTAAPTTPSPTTPTPTTPTPTTPVPTTATPTTPAPTAPTPPAAICSQCRAGCIVNGVCALEGNQSFTEATCKGVGTFCPPVVQFALQFLAQEAADVLQQDVNFINLMAEAGSEVLFGVPDKKERVVVTLSDVGGGRRLAVTSTNAIRADYLAILTEAEAASISQTMESDPLAALAMFEATFNGTSFGFQVDQASVEALIGSIQTGVQTMQNDTAGRIALPTPPPTSRQDLEDGDETSGVGATYSVSSILLLLPAMAAAVGIIA